MKSNRILKQIRKEAAAKAAAKEARRIAVAQWKASGSPDFSIDFAIVKGEFTSRAVTFAS